MVIEFPQNATIFNEKKVEETNKEPKDILGFIVGCINDLDLAVKVVLLDINNSQLLSIMLQALTRSYDHSLIIKNPALKRDFKMKVESKDSGKEISFIRGGTGKYILKLPDKIFEPTPMQKVTAYYAALELFAQKNKVGFASGVLKVVFKNANELMDLVKDTPDYQLMNLTLCKLSNFLTSTFQDQVIKALMHHWKESFPSLAMIVDSYFENTQLTLLDRNKKVIALLEPLIGVKGGNPIQLDSERIRQLEPTIMSKERQQDVSVVGGHGVCHIKLAEAYFNLSRYEDSLNHYLRGSEIQGFTAVIINNICNGLNLIGRYDLTDQLINLLEESDFKKILQLQYCSEYINIDEINLNNLPTFLKNRTLPHKVKIAFDSKRAVGEDINKEYFTQQILSLKREGIEPIILITLANYCGINELAKSLFTQIPPDEFQINLQLQKLKSLLDSTDSGLVQSVSQYSMTNTEKATLLANAASSLLVDDKNGKIALSHAEQGLKFDPENEDLTRAAFFAAILSGDKEKVQKFFDRLSGGQKSDIAEDCGVTVEELGNIDSLLIRFNPQREHEYHKIQNEQKLHEVVKAIAPMLSGSTSWKVHDKTINSSDMAYVGNYKGMECYGCIDPKLEDNSKVTKNTLGKGIVTRDEGNNGWKFIGGHGIELKANTDNRYFTNKVYVNKSGYGLIILNHDGNHKATSRFMSEHTMEYITVEDGNVNLVGQATEEN